jgi:hypothetical protein
LLRASGHLNVVLDNFKGWHQPGPRATGQFITTFHVTTLLVLVALFRAGATGRQEHKKRARHPHAAVYCRRQLFANAAIAASRVAS